MASTKRVRCIYGALVAKQDRQFAIRVIEHGFNFVKSVVLPLLGLFLLLGEFESFVLTRVIDRNV